MCIRDSWGALAPSSSIVMTPQFVVTVAMNVLPAAVFLSGRVPVRLSVGTFGGLTQPATEAAGVEAAAVGWSVTWPVGWPIATILTSLFNARLTPTNPPITR